MSGKAIYTPKGKAGEYAAFACNFYVGCSNQCSYCYNRRFPLLAGDRPRLRKAFTSETDALVKFIRELHGADGSVREDLRREGVMFTFTSDPMLPKCIILTAGAIRACLEREVPATILTKCALWVDDPRMREVLDHPRAKKLLAVGFTVTGHDEMEPKADRNDMRIHALKTLHGQGFHTFVSIEPIFDLATAVKMAEKCAPHADILKFGLNSGSRQPASSMTAFVSRIGNIAKDTDTKVYFKESIRKCIGGESPKGANFVEADWNIFNHNSKILQP